MTVLFYYAIGNIYDCLVLLYRLRIFSLYAGGRCPPKAVLSETRIYTMHTIVYAAVYATVENLIRHHSLYLSTYVSSEGRSWYLPVGFRFNSV